jgi:hypothetical protein
MWKIIKWSFGILFVLFILGSLIDKSEKKSKPTGTSGNVGVETKKLKEPLNAPEPKLTPMELLAKAKKLIDENNPDSAIANLQMIEMGSNEYPEAQKLLKQSLLSSAKKLLDEKPKYSSDDNSETYLWQAASKLEFIKKGDKEYPEAKKLLTQVHARQNNIHAETEELRAITRKDYAKELENNLLNNARMDTTITTSGKNNTTLKLKYILVSRVFVNELTKDGKLQNTWRSMGFKTIIFTNGYNETWTMNLEK